MGRDRLRSFFGCGRRPGRGRSGSGRRGSSRRCGNRGIGFLARNRDRLVGVKVLVYFEVLVCNNQKDVAEKLILDFINQQKMAHDTAGGTSSPPLLEG